MNPISPIDRLLQSVRAKAVDRHARAPDAHTPTDARTPRPGAAAAVHIAQRIGSIARDDPDRRPRAFRAFLEASLLDLFDEPALADPAFQVLIDRTQRALADDAGLATAIERVVDVLLAATDDGSLARQLDGVLANGRVPKLLHPFGNCKPAAAD